MKTRRLQKTQKGFTLVEVLVSMLVLTTGTLGVAGMQVVSVQTNQSAYARSQAVYLTKDIFDRMRANPRAYTAGTTYDSIDSSDGEALPADPGCVVSQGGCTPAQMAQQDIREWSGYFSNVSDDENYRPVLPNGRGVVVRDGISNDFTATISWDEKTWEDDTQVVQTRQVSIRATLN